MRGRTLAINFGKAKIISTLTHLLTYISEVSYVFAYDLKTYDVYTTAL